MTEARSRATLAIAVWIVLVVTVTAWRKGIYFEGALDSVVVAKAGLQVVALALAVLLRKMSSYTYPVAGGPLLAVLAVLAVSTIGALQAGNFTASAVLVVRVVLLASTVVLLVSVVPRTEALRQIVVGVGVVGAILALTGVGSIASGGRLEGVVLPLSPNGLIVLCAIPALAAIHRVISGRATPGTVAAACFFSAACLLTQSRTALLGMAIAVVVLVVSTRRIQRSVAIVLVVAVPALLALAVHTTFFVSILNREGSASLFTLNSRTIAWQVVLQTPFESLQKWVGAGLSVKTVSVRGQYWNEQVLDSSWISALAQTGLVGTAILALLAGAVLVVNVQGGSRNALPIALLVFLTVRAFLETGLLDASVTFMVFIALACTFVRPSEGRAKDGSTASGWPSVSGGSDQEGPRRKTHQGADPVGQRLGDDC